KDEPLRRFTSAIPSGRFEPAGGVATLSGVAVETDDATGLATKIAPVRIGGRLEPTLPGFWEGWCWGGGCSARPACGERSHRIGDAMRVRGTLHESHSHRPCGDSPSP